MLVRDLSRPRIAQGLIQLAILLSFLGGAMLIFFSIFRVHERCVQSEHGDGRMNGSFLKWCCGHACMCVGRGGRRETHDF